MIPPRTPLEQEYERIYCTDFSGKTEDEIKTYIDEKLNYLNVLSSIQYKLDALTMSQEQLQSEVHRSGRLGRHMEQEGLNRPAPKFDAHAIVSGRDRRANALRVEMAIRKIRIDDSDNGAWLPKSRTDAIGTRFPKAVPHCRIHNNRYYTWLERIGIGVNLTMNAFQFRHRLKMVRFQLQSGAVTGSVLKD